MNTQLLKATLSEALESCTVKAALFTSFNFEPRFFENYVLPLLLPKETFGQNELFNNIRWRWLYAQKKVPPVVVYTDQYAKSAADAPMLDYKVHSISMPGKGEARGAFHPKISLVLAQKDGAERLIVLCGSGNLTQGGWCKNVEAFSAFTLVPGSYFPRLLRDNLVQLLEQLGSLHKKTESESEAEKAIHAFLQKRNRTEEETATLYHSGMGSLADFLNTQLGTKTIARIEVFSPYFSVTDVEVGELLALSEDVRIQVPMLAGHAVLAEKVFDNYAAAGSVWYHPPAEIDRWCHAKVYRFFASSGTAVYTLLGSANLTTAAWSGLGNRTAANMEAAMLFTEKVKSPHYLLLVPAERATLSFQPDLAEGDNAEMGYAHRYETPDILFTIDWTAGEIAWQSKALKYPCTLMLPGLALPISGKGSKALHAGTEGHALAPALAKNSLLRVEEKRGEKTIDHYYYPAQIGFLQKPFPIRHSVTDILALWDKLGEEDALDDNAIAALLEELTECMVDASGAVHSNGYIHSSLLNEQARYLSALIGLERYLFKPDFAKLPQYKQAEARSEIIYYLTANNINTLPAFLSDLALRQATETVQKGFLVILLSLLQSRFYEVRQLKKHLGKELFAEHKKELAAISAQLDKTRQEAIRRSDLSAAKIKWFEEELAL